MTVGYFLHDSATMTLAYDLVKEYDAWQRKQDRLYRKSQKAKLKFKRGRWFSDDRIKHGMSGTVEYRAWLDMKQRCLNPKHKFYPDYGGRGITVHPAWIDDFMAFYKHVEPRPTKRHSLDRICVNGNYEPGNVRWATKKQQSRNRRCCK